jgi:hypothetical protein
MGFRVEDHFVEVERLRRRGQQVKVFEGLGKEEAGHRIGLFFSQDTLQLFLVATPGVQKFRRHMRPHVLDVRG